uniref:Venom protein family 10 protein 1 n=1 Tax=Lethocerus distinctifemur TaxID=280095 RepID=A0A2K8JNP5_9HEMI|nr:venom protein family 10 protein 1 [Lethocerus distinctifemur]
MQSVDFIMKTFPVISVLLALFSRSLQAPAMQGINVMHVNYNGSDDLKVIVNGKPVDFSKAKIITETDTYILYQPEDNPNVEITKYKQGGVSIKSTDGSNIQITSGNSVLVSNASSEEINRYVHQIVNSAMTQLQSTLSGLENRIASAFPPNFPFN